MPQVFIDSTATPDQLRLTARFLQDLAALAEGETISGAEAPTVAPVAVPFVLTAAPAPSLDRPMLPPLEPTAAEAFAKPAPVEIPPPPPPPPPSAPTAGRIDKDGLPHDTRIHSATPSMNRDGRWRRRRGLDNPTLLAVETELRAGRPAMVIPPPPPVIPPPPVAPPPPAATVMVPPPPPVAAGLPSGTDAFIMLMNLISPHTGEGGRLALDIMKPVHAEFGANGWADYHTRLRDKIPTLTERLVRMMT